MNKLSKIEATVKKTMLEMLAARELSQTQAEQVIRGIERNSEQLFCGDRVMDAVFPED